MASVRMTVPPATANALGPNQLGLPELEPGIDAEVVPDVGESAAQTALAFGGQGRGLKQSNLVQRTEQLLADGGVCLWRSCRHDCGAQRRSAPAADRKQDSDGESQRDGRASHVPFQQSGNAVHTGAESSPPRLHRRRANEGCLQGIDRIVVHRDARAAVRQQHPPRRIRDAGPDLHFRVGALADGAGAFDPQPSTRRRRQHHGLPGGHGSVVELRVDFHAPTSTSNPSPISAPSALGAAAGSAWNASISSVRKISNRDSR